MRTIYTPHNWQQNPIRENLHLIGRNGRTPGDDVKRVTEMDAAKSAEYGITLTIHSYAVGMNKFDPDVYKLQCSKCNRRFPASKYYFNKDARYRHNFDTSRCKACRADYMRLARRQKRTAQLLSH